MDWAAREGVEVGMGEVEKRRAFGSWVRIVEIREGGKEGEPRKEEGFWV